METRNKATLTRLEIGEIVRRLRVEKGVTMHHAGALLGVGPNCWANLENGHRNLKVQEMLLLMNEFPTLGEEIINAFEETFGKHVDAGA